MLGINFPEFIRFLMQVGAAVVGAASFWGMVFVWRSRRPGQDSFRKLAEVLMRLFTAAFILFVITWLLGAFIFYPSVATAHEGITLKAMPLYIAAGFRSGADLMFLFVLTALVNFWLYYYRRPLWQKYAVWLFGAQFLLVSAVLLLAVFSGQYDARQFYYSFHSWHSIFTLGTVITVDFLFLAVLTLHAHRKTLYNFFFVISAFIWAGLGVDFLSNALVFEEAFQFSTQFKFIQTVVAILIINGALLSGRISEALTVLKEADHIGRDTALGKIIGVSGAVSIVSWLTITFVDFFRFGLSYWQFLLIFLTAIIAAYYLHRPISYWLGFVFKKHAEE